MAFRGLTNNEKQITNLARQIAQANKSQSQALSNLQGARAGYDAASNKTLGGTLGSVLSGIGNSIKNIGDTAWLATSDLINGWRDIAEGKSKNAEDSYTQQARKKILGGNNAKERYGMAGGKALDAAVTLSDLIPGVAASPVANIAQGALSGIGQTKAENPNATGEEILRNALVGGGAGAAGLVAGNALGKVANKTFKNATAKRLANAATSQLGRGAIGGAAAGATGAGLATALNGGGLGDVLSNMAQGAQSGALGGATVAGTLGLAGRGYSALKNRAMGAQNGAGAINAPIANDLPILKKNPLQGVTDAPEAQVRQRIPIADYDAGTEQVPVNIRNTRKGTGRFIDGYVQGENLPEGALRTQKGYIDDIVRGKNLPESQLPNNDRLIAKLFGIEDGDNRLAEAIARGEIGDATDTLDYLNGVAPRDINKIREGAIDYWNDTHDEGVFGAYKNKSDLPKIDLDDYKDYWLGRYGIERSDIEPELLPFVEQGGRKLGSSEWGDIGLKSGEYTPDDILDKYREFANTDMRRRYFTNENIGGALASDKDLANRVSEAVINDNNMRKSIDVQGGPARADEISVNTRNIEPTAPQGMAEPNYTRRMLNTEPETALAPRQRADVAPIETEAPQITHAQRAQLERQYTEARQRQGEALLSQYGTLDAPTRRAVGSPEDVLATLQSEYGLTTPAEVQYAANHVTGKDGAISKWTRELAAQAENVETAVNQNWLDDLIANNGLTDEEAKAVTKQITSALKRTGASGYSDGNTALDTVKQLESQIRQIKGQGGNYHRMTDSDARRAAVLGTVKDELQARIWDAAGDTSKVITPERLAELKSYYDGNEAWANFVDNGIGQVKNGGDLRHLMKPLVDGSKIVEGSRMSAGGFADTIANEVKGASAKSLTGAIFKAGKDKLMNSPKAKLNRANKAALEAQNVQAQLNGEAPIKKTIADGIKAALAGNAGKVADKAVNIAERMAAPFNDTTISNAYILERPNGEPWTIGDIAANRTSRIAGINEGNYAINRNELQNATTGYENAANDYANAYTNAEALKAQIPQPTAQPQQSASPLSKLSQAMDLAMAAGDMTAWTQLADLYTQAAKVYGGTETEEASSPYADLETSQLENINKVDNAANSIDELEALFTQAGGGKGLIGGNLANFQASLGLNNDVNTYNSLSQGLINQIMAATGKTDTLNTEAEVRRALKLVPQFTDTQEVAQSKLNALRQMLGNTKQTMLQNYGVAE